MREQHTEIVEVGFAELNGKQQINRARLKDTLSKTADLFEVNMKFFYKTDEGFAEDVVRTASS